MASWPAIVVWCSAATLEFVGKCVPVIDQIMDAAMAFIVPFIVSFYILLLNDYVGTVFAPSCAVHLLYNLHSELPTDCSSVIHTTLYAADDMISLEHSWSVLGIWFI